MSQQHEMYLGAAFYEGLRWWLTFDGPQTTLIKRNNGRMTGADVKRIAREYGFARNMSGDGKKLEEVAKRINRFSNGEWASLMDRLDAIEDAIVAIKEIENVRFRLVSGTTKLCWFVAPKNWTPFDSFAAAGVGIGVGGDQLGRMKRYYQTIHDRGFLECARSVENHLSGTFAEDVGGERILDKFLMMLGDESWGNATREFSETYVETFPSDLREAARDLASAIAADACCHL
jgi:hypothetical protein